MHHYITHLLAVLPSSVGTVAVGVLIVVLLFIGPSGAVDALRRWGFRFLRWADRVERVSRIRPRLKILCRQLLLALADLFERAEDDPPAL